MARKLKSDKVLFLATLLLVCSSVVMVYSASAVLAMNRFNQPYFFLTKQAMWAALGLAAMSIAMRFDYRHYREPSFIWMALGVVVFALVAVLFSAPINGSRRWFGVAGFGVQPSELAKLSAIFFIAALLERRMDRIDEIPHALVPIGVVVGGLVGLILLEPDLGTAMTLLLIAVVMIFAAGLSYRYVVGAILCGLPVIYFILMSAAYRRRRLMAFWDPWSDPLGDGFQVIQSLIAVGSGGLIGRGFMAGVQKLFYLPEPHTDFIFAVIGEEFGLLGHDARVGVFPRDCVARLHDRDAGAGSLRRIPRGRADDDDRRAGIFQHQRRARARADQRDTSAVREPRRIVLADQPAGHGHLAQCVSAHGP